MHLPTTLSMYAIWLFFLWYGLAAFIPALNSDLFKKIAGVLALLFVVFNLLGM
jgi:hypothetical protein